MAGGAYPGAWVCLEELLDFGWKGRTRVSIESMEERQPIYTGVKGGLAGMLAEHE